MLSLLSVATPLISKVLDLIPDPKMKAQVQYDMYKLAKEGEFKELDNAFNLSMQQVMVNQEEAKADNIFKSGWRPAIGWVCVAAFSYIYVISPVLVQIFHIPIVNLDVSTLMTLLFGILGLGAFRSYEK